MKESLGTRRCPYTGAVIELFYTGAKDRLGKDRLTYCLTHEGNVIFEGDDFCCSPLHAIDSNETFGSILGFLSLRPGDTDDSYFEDYSTRRRHPKEERQGAR